MLRAIETLANLWEFSDFRLVILLFVLPILLCNQRGRTGSLSLSLSPKDSISLSRPLSHLLDAPVRAKFAISNFDVECAKVLTKNKVAKVACLAEWVDGAAGRRFADTFYYATFELEKAARLDARKREARTERRDERFIWLRGFVSSAFWRSQLLHHHRHSLTYIHYTYTQISVLDFFFQSLDFDDILRGIQRFSNWL